MTKGRESEMPPPELWEGFFEPDSILEALGCGASPGDLVEFGCGYGTFTIAAARRVSGTVYASDVDPAIDKSIRRCLLPVPAQRPHRRCW